MIDPNRHVDSEIGVAEDERARAIEELLLAGLDLYFAGEYERAIHAWTRVWFLDRSNARARAYIERARAVLAERQRETDELLHRGLAALDAGDTHDAHRLLSSAVRHGGVAEAAEVALERLGRLTVPASTGVARRVMHARADDAPSQARGRRWVPIAMASAATVLLLCAGALALGWTPPPLFPPGQQSVTTAVGRRVGSNEPLPRVDPAALSLRRARLLFARGHLHGALTELARIRQADPRHAEAVGLKAQVQRALFETIVDSDERERPVAPRP